MIYDVTIQTVAWFNSRRSAGTLTLSPRWQRRAVWLEKERESLIETVMLKLPFPEVYVQVIVNSDTGAEQYVVVDGQQRLTSLFRFIDGLSDLPDTEQWMGKSFVDLNPTEKQDFWGYKIVTRQIKANADAEIRDLFTRLNTNTVASRSRCGGTT